MHTCGFLRDGEGDSQIISVSISGVDNISTVPLHLPLSTLPVTSEVEKKMKED